MSAAPPTFRTQLSQARQLSSNALESFTQLEKAAAIHTPLAVMPADPRTEPAFCEDYDLGSEAFDQEVIATFEQLRGQTRVIGPASKGVVLGEGNICLVGSFGPRFDTLKRALGSRLGAMVDVGLAWDLSPSEVLSQLLEDGGCDRVGLVLPFEPLSAPGLYVESLSRGLPALFRSWAHRVPFYLLSPSASAYDVFAPYGVGVVHSTAAFLALMAAEKPTLGVKGPRIAVISELGSGEDVAVQMLKQSRLSVAIPDAITCQLLASELPRASRVGEALYLPSPTQRHLETASRLLAQAPHVDGVWNTPTEGNEPLRIEMMQAAAVVAPFLGQASGLAFEPVEPTAETYMSLAARKVMRAWHLERSDVAGLFGLQLSRAEIATTLSSARHLAQSIGYPVGLWHHSKLYRLTSETELDARWEQLREELGASAPTALFERYATAWQATLLAHPEQVERLDYRLAPFPRVRWRDQDIALPLGKHQLESIPQALHSVFGHLSQLAISLNEICELTLYVSATGEFITGAGQLGQGLALDAKRSLFSPSEAAQKSRYFHREPPSEEDA